MCSSDPLPANSSHKYTGPLYTSALRTLRDFALALSQGHQAGEVQVAHPLVAVVVEVHAGAADATTVVIA